MMVMEIEVMMEAMVMEVMADEEVTEVEAVDEVGGLEEEGEDSEADGNNTIKAFWRRKE